MSKVNPASKTAEQMDSPNNDAPDEYECPFCDFTDKSEKEVRNHISSESDSAHGDRNGYDFDVIVKGPEKDMESTPEDNGSLTAQLMPDAPEKYKDVVHKAVEMGYPYSDTVGHGDVADEVDYGPQTVEVILVKYIDIPMGNISIGELTKSKREILEWYSVNKPFSSKTEAARLASKDLDYSENHAYRTIGGWGELSEDVEDFRYYEPDEELEEEGQVVLESEEVEEFKSTVKTLRRLSEKGRIECDAAFEEIEELTEGMFDE